MIGHSGEALGILYLRDALEAAERVGLDLVEVAPEASPPVAKIMDYSKFKYEKEKKQKEANKKARQTSLKEVRFKVNIHDHDFDTKKDHVSKFLQTGHKVKITIQFFGREMAHTELGTRLINRMVNDLQSLAKPENSPKLEGKRMCVILSPLKKN